ncbi:MAG: lipoprotein-releasing ABC transporter permease subunit [Magnetococcales bacterium]|nr:lipoprotein-releasing ABC transporter permease subunit [Magnetococcales bacterium]
MLKERYEWFIGLRYLKAKRSQKFIGVITFLSMGGIALGVAALIVVLAVMTGFRAELQKQILGVTSHVVVQAYGGRMSGYEGVLQQVKQSDGVVGASPFILGQALLSAGGRAAGAVVRGIVPALDRGVSSLAKNIKYGDVAHIPGFGIVLGRHLASSLGVGLRDSVTVTVPVGNVTVMGAMPRMKRFRVVGIFDSGMYEYDNTLAYIHLPDAQALFQMRDRATGVEVRAERPALAMGVAENLRTKLGESFWIRDWMQMNRNFFRALKLEKATMFVILLLVVLVAAFNIVSSLIMVVMEKGRDIAILKTMGASESGIMAIFVINGGVIGLFGTLAGLGLGLLLSFNLEAALGFIEKLFDIQILSGDVYYIDHLPSVVTFADVAWVTGLSLVISLLATLYPAWRAARVDPVDALRYE